MINLGVFFKPKQITIITKLTSIIFFKKVKLNYLLLFNFLLRHVTSWEFPKVRGLELVPRNFIIHFLRRLAS